MSDVFSFSFISLSCFIILNNLSFYLVSYLFSSSTLLQWLIVFLYIFLISLIYYWCSFSFVRIVSISWLIYFSYEVNWPSVYSVKVVYLPILPFSMMLTNFWFYIVSIFIWFLSSPWSSDSPFPCLLFYVIVLIMFFKFLITSSFYCRTVCSLLG